MNTQLNSSLKQAWKEQIRQVAARNPRLARQLWHNRQAYFDRFAQFYRQLANLPRKFRRKFLRRLATTLAGAALLLALGQTLPALAATITVDGVTCTLAEAITSANNDFAHGNGCVDGSGADTIDLQTDVTLSALLPTITSEITLEGNGHTLDGNNSFRVLYVQSTGNLTLNDTTITGGYTSGNGGGLYNTGTLMVNNSTLSSNSAAGGGGIRNSGILTVNNSTLSGNSSINGGGISSYGTLTVNNSTLSGNSASNHGGGIQNAGTLTVNNSTLSDNSGHVVGGGIANIGGGSILTINNSTLSGNSSDGLPIGGWGGGILNNGTLTLNNSTLSGNSAKLAGGIYNNFGTVNLNRSLISGNSSPSAGPEIRNHVGTVIGNNYNVIGYGAYARSYGFTPGPKDIIPFDPLETVLDITLADNGGSTLTHALIPGSVAIDAAPDAVCLAPPINGVDQRGFPRNLDGDGVPSANECDAGAFEVELTGTPPPTPTPFPPQAHINGTDCSLADAIVAANTDTPTGDCAAGNPGADTITVLSNILLLSNLPPITSEIALEGDGHTLDGNDVFRVLYVQASGDLTLNNATITGGNTGGNGGGILNFGTLSVNDSTLTGNSTGNNGGGIWNFGTATVTNTALSGNSADYGGGISNFNGTLTLNASTVSGNVATFGGGGIINSGGVLIVNNSTVSGNSALDSCYFCGGGGIENITPYSNDTLTLNNSTVTGNSTGNKGGGIFIRLAHLNTVSLNHSLISGNQAAIGFEVFTFYTIAANNYNVIGYWGSARSFGFTPGALDIIPPGALDTVLDTVLADNGGSTLTHALVSGSVAIDAAPDAACLALPINGIDQRGFPRNVDGDGIPSSNECDSGAFEYAPSGLPTPTPTVISTASASPTATGSPSPTATATSSPTSTSLPDTTPTARPTRTPTPRPTRTPTQTLIIAQESALVPSAQEQAANPLLNFVVVTLLALGNLLWFRKERT